MRPELSKFLAKTAASLSLLSIGALVKYLMDVAIARMATKEAFGAYGLLYAAALIIATIGAVGMTSAVTRFIAVYEQKDDWPSIIGLRYFSTWYPVGATTLIALFLSLATWSSSLAALEPELVVLGIWLAPFIVIVNVKRAVLQGLHEVFVMNGASQILMPVASLAIAYAVFLKTGVLPAFAIILSMAGGALVAAIAQDVATSRVISARLQVACVPVTHRALWLKESKGLMAVSVLNLLMMRLDVLLLTAFIPLNDVAIYIAAQRTSSLVAFILTASNNVVAPMIAREFSSGELARLKSVVRWATVLAALPAVAVLVCMIVWGPSVLSLFGAGYQAGHSVLIILCVGQFINAVTGPVGTLMTMTGHQRDAARVLFYALAIGVAFGVLLTPRYGIEGAAIATALAQIIWNARMFFLSRGVIIDASEKQHSRNQGTR